MLWTGTTAAGSLVDWYTNADFPCGPVQTVFWSIQFKYNLEFGDGKEAYEAMMSIPDHTL